eukprot:CAMPEP_0198557906 /NCGR_PEP_ID=MMETSP1462-20131121/89524_1 /TAXON_ID=1333877 /ORGANISM="Brandtodinium nutriculum, Strain RCC3387" /LENGTH=50 /DNA_ID=CAMNT_0044288711 /DNA_START=48 /DNA_END=197 /DNA_ORIENTATION=+
MASYAMAPRRLPFAQAASLSVVSLRMALPRQGVRGGRARATCAGARTARP